MAVRRFEELFAWQRAHELEVRVYELTAKPHVAEDRDFSDQVRSAVSSVPANIAEGFGRFAPAEFARFLDIARGSLLETQSHLRKARAVRYLTVEEFDRLWQLSQVAVAATTRLRRSLDRSPYRSSASGPRARTGRRGR